MKFFVPTHGTKYYRYDASDAKNDFAINSEKFCLKSLAVELFWGLGSLGGIGRSCVEIS